MEKDFSRDGEGSLHVVEFIKLHFTYIQPVYFICPEMSGSLQSLLLGRRDDDVSVSLPFIVCRLFKRYLPEVNLDNNPCHQATGDWTLIGERQRRH